MDLDNHGFLLFDDTLAVADLYNTGLISSGRPDVTSYHRVFALLAEHAVDIGPALDEYQNKYVDLLQRRTH
nr:hypothetical protein Ade03nite_02240 [Actinoplanes derwentensis]